MSNKKKVKAKASIQPEEFVIKDKPGDNSFESSFASALKQWSDLKLQEKTDLTSEERFLLPLLKIMATNPYPLWSKKTGIKIVSKQLLQFIEDYDSRGLSVKRQSRIEMRDIFAGAIEYLKSKILKQDEKLFSK